MGKLHKHQKKLKAEKSKVKLRVKGEKTKFLPKGLNVTDTTFKIKPITLPQQLQEKSNQEPLSKRKLNTKELIQRLKHHNVNVKVDSGEELCLIINAYPEEILNKYLSELLQSTCHLVLDKERKVRKICVKLMLTILKNTSIIKIEPLYGIISSFLRCCMTNIDVNIQEDSLMLLDALLLHVPSLVAKDSDKLLSNFLTLISTLRSDSKPGRTLTINLGSKLTTVKWKIKVLHRLKGILQAVIELNKKDNKIDQTEIPYQLVDSTSCFPVYKKIKCYDSFVFDKLKSNVGNKDSILNQIKSLITLLYESWLEVAPENVKTKQTAEFTNIQPDTAAVLNCILNIMHLLNVYVQEFEKNNSSKQEITSHAYLKFIKSLVQHFPYSQVTIQQNKSNIEKILDVQIDPKCLQENLLICYLFCIIPNNTKSNEVDKILLYVNKCLQNRNYIPTDKMQYLIPVLRILLIDNKHKLKEINDNDKKLLENMINFYNNKENSKACKRDVLCLLADIMNNPLLNKFPKYQVWLSKLPALLCEEEIHVNVINKLSLIAKQGSGPFYNSLLKIIKPILDNVLRIKIIENGKQVSAIPEELLRIKILNIFTHCTKMFQQHIEVIKEFAENNENTTYGDYMKFNFVYC